MRILIARKMIKMFKRRVSLEPKFYEEEQELKESEEVLDELCTTNV